MLSTKKLDRLTEEQKSAMIAFRETCRKTALSIDPIDRGTTRSVLVDFYGRIGKKGPIIWVCDSPLQAQVWIHLFQKGIGANLEDNLWANLEVNLRANLRANLVANLGDNLVANLWANLVDNLGDNLRANLRANLGANLRANLGANLEDIKHEQTWLWGSMDMSWIAYYRYPHENIRPMYSDENYNILLQWYKLASSCGWWWPFENICFVSDRPKEYHFDSSWRLHNPNGPAISYRDGYSLYAVHGVIVTDKIVSREFVVEDIKSEQNTEIRRVMLDLFGTDKYLKAIGSTPIHSDKTGILYCADVPDDEPIAMVRLLNSTPEPDGTLTTQEAIDLFGQAADHVLASGPDSRWKEYWIRVPPDMKTAAEAVAWSFGMTESTYAPSVET